MVEPDPYSELIRRTNGAMVLVTAGDGNERAGCLVGFHHQCGIEPLRHAVWLSKANHTYRVALHAEHLAVHFLTPDREQLARHFGAHSGDEVDKFADVAWTPGPGGTPLLDELPDRFVGRRLATLDVGGDHACFVLCPEDAVCSEGYHPLRIGALDDLEPGHGVEERPVPAETRDPDGS